MTEKVRIRRDELFTAQVDSALATRDLLRSHEIPELTPLSPLQEVLASPLFRLPLAGLLATLIAWMLLEPSFTDMIRIGGEVQLVTSDPFEFSDYFMEGVSGPTVSLTVGDKEVVFIESFSWMEAGADGQEAFDSVADVEIGGFVEASGEALDANQLLAYALRPATPERAARTGLEIDTVEWAAILLFPLTAVLIAIAMILVEGISTRNWLRLAERLPLGVLLTALFSFLAFVPAGLLMIIAQLPLSDQEGFVTVGMMSSPALLFFAACRSGAWACIGAGLGVGLNLVRSTRIQLRNSVIGGALGGALGGAFFDPIDRFFGSGSAFQEAAASRLVGLLAVGLSVGFFLALVERLAREAWVRVRTGPLAGKSFVLYHSPTHLGSSPQSEIYLFKDAEVDPTHAAIHRVANRYELEDLDSRSGTLVGGQPIRRHRLASGDQIVVGATVLEYEERAR